MTILSTQIETLSRLQTQQVQGTVATVRGLSVLVDDLPLPVGSLVRIELGGLTGERIHGEVVGFERGTASGRSIVMLFSSSTGLTPGARVIGEQTTQTIRVGDSLLGRLIDGLGRPIDGHGRLHDVRPRPLAPPPVTAMQRRRITQPLPTGVRSLDAMLTLGRGQRVGIFSGPGVGKSTLLGMIARKRQADVNVIALVGERGREVREFIEDALGAEGLRKSVVVVATGDESPLLRVRAAMAASTIAEHFRDGGADVLLMMDSLTRFAHAQRQIGLTIGEQPATKGYTPSVFAMLPVLVERAGAFEGAGSITGIYTILVEGDDLTEPISDATRGVLDGHISLSRKFAMRSHYPAIDILDSISRVADDICQEQHTAARRTIVRLLAAYAQAEELITIGAYARGSNRDCDVAIAMKPAIDAFLTQREQDAFEYPASCKGLMDLAAEAARQYAALQAGARPAAVKP